MSLVLVDLEPSQAQPEVPINANNAALRAAFADLGIGSDTSSDTGASLPPGGTTGQVLTKASNADGDAEWSDPTGGGDTGGSGGPVLSATFKLSTAQSLAHNTEAVIDFDSSGTVQSDTGGFTGHGSGKFVITDAGTYLLIGHAEFGNSTSGGRQVGFKVNGGATESLVFEGTVGAYQTMNTTTLRHFDAGDYVQMAMFQNSGGAIDAATDGTFFSIAKLTSATAGTDPDSRSASPDAMDDEFEGTSIDPKWTKVNASTAVYSVGQGALSIKSDTASTSGGMNVLSQPLPAGSAWKFRAKLSGYIPSATNDGGLVIFESGSTRQIRFTVYNSGGLHVQVLKQTAFNPPGSSTSIYDQTTTLPFFLGSMGPVYMEIELASGTLYFRMSGTGYEGSFLPIASYAVSSVGFTTAPDSIGVFAEANNTSDAAVIRCDWFRRIA